MVAILASMQTSPRCIMVHREMGIQSLSDLHDVTLALGAGKAFAKFLQQELPLKTSRSCPTPAALPCSSKTHSSRQQAYVFSEPYVVRQKGAEPVTLMVSQLGFDPIPAV